MWRLAQDPIGLGPACAKGHFDAVIDFDAATRDATTLTRFRPEADSPDLLHPGDAGYRLMAEKIDLRLFSRR